MKCERVHIHHKARSQHKLHLKIVEPFFEFDFISMVRELSPTSDAKIWAQTDHGKYCEFHFRFRFQYKHFHKLSGKIAQGFKLHKKKRCERKSYVKTIKIEDN